MKKYILATAIYILLTATIAILNEIAYHKSIFDVWWVAFVYLYATSTTSYYIAKSLLKSEN